MIQDINQNKDHRLEILQGNVLSFLFKFKKEILKKIRLELFTQVMYKWNKDNISYKL